MRIDPVCRFIYNWIYSRKTPEYVKNVQAVFFCFKIISDMIKKADIGKIGNVRNFKKIAWNVRIIPNEYLFFNECYRMSLEIKMVLIIKLDNPESPIFPATQVKKTFTWKCFDQLLQPFPYICHNYVSIQETWMYFPDERQTNIPRSYAQTHERVHNFMVIVNYPCLIWNKETEKRKCTEK